VTKYILFYYEVWTNIWQLHHDERVFKDPNIFKVDRFLDNDGKVVLGDHPLRKRYMAIYFFYHEMLLKRCTLLLVWLLDGSYYLNKQDILVPGHITQYPLCTVSVCSLLELVVECVLENPWRKVGCLFY